MRHPLRLFSAAALVALALTPVVPANADAPNCPNGTVCTWLLPNFTGDRKVFDPANGPRQALGDHQHLVDSWTNKTNKSWALTERAEGGLDIVLDCLGPGQSRNNVPDAVTILADGLLELSVPCLL